MTIPARVRGSRAGFTVLELAIVVAIMAVGAAIAIPMFMEYMKKPAINEPSVQLGKLRRSIEKLRAGAGAYPTGTATVLPTSSCCSFVGQRCPIVPKQTWAADPIWNELRFSIEEATLFQYGYTSDGTQFTATAVGDIDCDGERITYSLVGGTDGTIQLKAPNNRD